MIGQRFGHYRVLQQLGSGGMGIVYLAEDEVLCRKVAIKVLRLSPLEDIAAKARFLREARAVAALNHPNIAVLYETGEIGGEPFLVMEYVEGSTLRESLGTGPFGTAKWLRCATGLASALQHAHEHGILHRDIKSANVIVATDDTPKLLDFGLAQFQQTNADTKAETGLTAPGTWVGTLQYAAPEVLSGRPADFASDVYSLGVVLYEMACGQSPFAALEGPQLVAAIMQGQIIAPSRQNSAIPVDLSRIVERATARQPADRITASELSVALQEFASGHGARGRPGYRPAAPVLAVLEFQNVGGDASDDWLKTGIAETLRTDLQKVKSIRVVTPERIHALQRHACAAGQELQLGELGSQLGAQWIITGSYQRAGARLRITSRMLEVATGDVVCTAKVDGAWLEIFELQDKLVHELMASLQVAIDDTAKHRIATPETLELEAYEHYAYARKKFHEMGKTSLEEARLHFERALTLDPNYAVAHSGLGATYAMRYIHRTDPDDLTQALGHLERARELDPELGEPYPFLCYVYMRRGRLEQAVSAGERGVEIQPDLVQAHYFLAAAHAVSSELDPRHYQTAVDCLLRAAQVEPGWQASWIILSEIALLNGKYDRAEEYVQQSVEIERSGRMFNRFLGTEIILGNVWVRRGNLSKAIEMYTQALKMISTVDHAYREAMLALSACLRAEVHLRQRHGDLALADLHYAWRTVKEYPRMLGNERLTIQVLAGMAGAYHAQGQQSRSRELVQQALAHLQNIFRCPQSYISLMAVPNLCHALALTLLRIGDNSAALDLLHEAVRTGWRDEEWLACDEELMALHDEPRFQSALHEIHQMPAVRFPTFGLPESHSARPSGRSCKTVPEGISH